MKFVSSLPIADGYMGGRDALISAVRRGYRGHEGERKARSMYSPRRIERSNHCRCVRGKGGSAMESCGSSDHIGSIERTTQ